MVEAPDNGREAGGDGSLRDAGGQLRDDISRLRRLARERSSEVIGGWRTWVEDHPLAALGVAFGLGYVIAGGLVSRATLRAVQLGGRLYLRKYLGDLVAGTLHDVLSPGGTDLAEAEVE